MPPDETLPPLLESAEGVLKLILGFAAGCLLLYMAYQTFEAGGTLNRELVRLLIGFLLAFFGVDILAVISRVQGKR